MWELENEVAMGVVCRLYAEIRSPGVEGSGILRARATAQYVNTSPDLWERAEQQSLHLGSTSCCQDSLLDPSSVLASVPNPRVLDMPTDPRVPEQSRQRQQGRIIPRDHT